MFSRVCQAFLATRVRGRAVRPLVKLARFPIAVKRAPAYCAWWSKKLVTPCRPSDVADHLYSGQPLTGSLRAAATECRWCAPGWEVAAAAANLPQRLYTTGAQKPAPGDGETPADETTSFRELYENPWTIPNFLCMARIGLSPILGYLIVEKEFHLSLGLFVLAGVTDLLDGYIARNWANQKSALGSALDPLADKILISVLYISLTYAHLIPSPLTALVISRDIALIAAVFYVRYRTVPPPRTLAKFFNPCYATAQLKPTFISKVNTAVQLILVAASLAAPVFQYVDSICLQALWYITATTTAASAYSYYHYGKKTVQVLNKKD
ncbi:cardiolipin synthase (CMP-forming) isoform X1 [Polypterus senegalus]|uniref:cardiolipin synthase (CMP-forming) isoform X1 n=1 Tax=Polypterus senegalus TaxID=55291 RepID=UPI001964372B|nr:cardiolipin synthase (CMP-forming) isoform X1 [Polypterus senegalus]